MTGHDFRELTRVLLIVVLASLAAGVGGLVLLVWAIS